MAATQTAVSVPTLPELETIIERGLATFIEVGTALREIHNLKLYQKDYDTFENYCVQRWGFSRSVGYDYLAAANVAENVGSTLQKDLTLTKAVALAPLTPESQKAFCENEPVKEMSVRELQSRIKKAKLEGYRERNAFIEVSDLEQVTTPAIDEIINRYETKQAEETAADEQRQAEYKAGAPARAAEQEKQNAAYALKETNRTARDKEREKASKQKSKLPSLGGLQRQNGGSFDYLVATDSFTLQVSGSSIDEIREEFTTRFGKCEVTREGSCCSYTSALSSLTNRLSSTLQSAESLLSDLEKATTIPETIRKAVASQVANLQTKELSASIATLKQAIKTIKSVSLNVKVPVLKPLSESTDSEEEK